MWRKHAGYFRVEELGEMQFFLAVRGNYSNFAMENTNLKCHAKDRG